MSLSTSTEKASRNRLKFFLIRHQSHLFDFYCYEQIEQDEKDEIVLNGVYTFTHSCVYYNIK